jgi:hypothetical protein
MNIFLDYPAMPDNDRRRESSFYFIIKLIKIISE